MNIFGANEEKNNFYRRLLTIAIPIIIQQHYRRILVVITVRLSRLLRR